MGIETLRHILTVPISTSSIGKLDKAWDEAQAKGWTVVNMKDDWKRIFAFEQQ